MMNIARSLLALLLLVGSVEACGTYSCPNGGTLSGSTCIKTQAASVSGYDCPAGWTVSGNQCKKDLCTAVYGKDPSGGYLEAKQQLCRYEVQMSVLLDLTLCHFSAAAPSFFAQVRRHATKTSSATQSGRTESGECWSFSAHRCCCFCSRCHGTSFWRGVDSPFIQRLASLVRICNAGLVIPATEDRAATGAMSEARSPASNATARGLTSAAAAPCRTRASVPTTLPPKCTSAPAAGP